MGFSTQSKNGLWAYVCYERCLVMPVKIHIEHTNKSECVDRSENCIKTELKNNVKRIKSSSA